ncbi:hypothetical protein A5887_001419, partial [Enterococcus faecium]
STSSGVFPDSFLAAVATFISYQRDK